MRIFLKIFYEYKVFDDLEAEPGLLMSKYINTFISYIMHVHNSKPLNEKQMNKT